MGGIGGEKTVQPALLLQNVTSYTPVACVAYHTSQVTFSYLKEYAVLSGSSSKHIAPMYIPFSLPNPAFLLKPLPLGTLFNHHRTLPSKKLFSIFSGILAGLFALHKRQLIHGDLKGENVLLQESGKNLTGTLCDFSHTYGAFSIEGNMFSAHLSFLVRQKLYPAIDKTAPEWLFDAGTPDLRPAEMWALGCLLFESLYKQYLPWAADMFTFYTAYPELLSKEIPGFDERWKAFSSIRQKIFHALPPFYKFIEKELDHVASRMKTNPSRDVLQVATLILLMAGCLHPDPDQRITIETALLMLAPALPLALPPNGTLEEHLELIHKHIENI